MGETQQQEMKLIALFALAAIAVAHSAQRQVLEEPRGRIQPADPKRGQRHPNGHVVLLPKDGQDGPRGVGPAHHGRHAQGPTCRACTNVRSTKSEVRAERHGGHRRQDGVTHRLASLAPTRPYPSPVASCSSNNKSCSSCRSLGRPCRPCCRWCHRQCCQEAGRLFEASCSQALSQGPEEGRQEGPQVRQEARHKVLYQTVYQSCRQGLPPGRWFPCCRCCGCCHRRRLQDRVQARLQSAGQIHPPQVPVWCQDGRLRRRLRLRFSRAQDRLKQSSPQQSSPQQSSP